MTRTAVAKLCETLFEIAAVFGLENVLINSRMIANRSLAIIISDGAGIMFFYVQGFSFFAQFWFAFAIRAAFTYAYHSSITVKLASQTAASCPGTCIVRFHGIVPLTQDLFNLSEYTSKESRKYKSWHKSLPCQALTFRCRKPSFRCCQIHALFSAGFLIYLANTLLNWV